MIFVTAWVKAREAVTVLADLTEACVDLCAEKLADQLGLMQSAGLT